MRVITIEITDKIVTTYRDDNERLTFKVTDHLSNLGQALDFITRQTQAVSVGSPAVIESQRPLGPRELQEQALEWQYQIAKNIFYVRSQEQVAIDAARRKALGLNN